MCHLFQWHTKRAQTSKCGIIKGWRESRPDTNVQLTFIKMTVDFSKDVMFGMLQKGATGTQILDILNVLVPDQTELTREQVCEDLGIADCPENDDEIARFMASAV